MHILVTNDDGPPSSQSSPYILSLVRALQRADHTVSVILPHTQRSWISKAHMVGQPIKPSYYRPPPSPTDPLAASAQTDEGTTSPVPLPPASTREEWVLVDSTPASCVQIGLHHYFQARGKVDLVVSGPNYGRNTTAVFALSSGTIGGAMEAAVCGVRAVALSYAFFDRNHDPEIIAEATGTAVRVIEGLVGRWDVGVGLYNINIPLQLGVSKSKVLWTPVLQNGWVSGSCFTEVEVPAEEDWSPEEGEAEIRRAESRDESGEGDGHVRYRHKLFKWTPSFKDVFESVDRAPPGNDGWAVKNGFVSVSPLQANFWHVGGFEGEVDL
ncbi:sure-like protein [Trichodelitschia bisporula]|uniref:Sure-like protein n=1 Tax=Trichodelitschia bisporula TaxID=703511 RepID=A0A6G1HNT1_9PEZI|nr:sure-like protein [Trichodelitschia bisporula]